MTREIRFNVGGDHKDDQPLLYPDRPTDHAPITTTFESPGRLLAIIPPECTGGATLKYQKETKEFRIILPPVDKQFQNEAGEPPQLPPEYNGDPDKVALHYAWAPPVRPGMTRVSGSVWSDDAGAYHPLGYSLFWAAVDPPRAKQNFDYIKRGGGDAVRILGKVNWAGEGIDPRDPVMLANIAQAIDYAYEAGLKVHFVVTGGGDDPVGAARILLPVLQARAQKLLLIEAVNEQNASEDDAVEIAKMMKAVGCPVAVGLGNTGIDTINAATDRAGVNAATLHEERSTDPARNIRQSWDFRLLHGAALAGEMQGAASSVAEETRPNMLAYARAARIICGAGNTVNHCGHGVFGRTYAYNANTPPGAPHSDTRFANLWEAPNADAIMAAVFNADKRLPFGIENWSKFNSNQPVTISSGDASKLYGCTDGGHFAEIAIGTTTPIVFRAERPVHMQIVDVATDNLLWEGDLNTGQQTSVSGLFAYVLIGQYR